jgi:hypothetical protein
MKRQRGMIYAGLCTIAMTSAIVAPAGAQTSEVKEKPPMYSYISNWDIPRAQWSEMAKADEADRPALEKALAGGTIVGYGSDVNLVHRADGETHDQWWSAMSMAGVINVLEQFYQSGSPTSPVLSSATKHWDELFVSRYYNWKSGTIKNGYSHVGFYKLKPDAPDDAVEMLSKNLVVPVLEKQLAAGVIAEYEIDTEAIHTEAPGGFLIVYLATNAEGLDKVQAAVEEALKANPMGGPAFGSMTAMPAHRDELVRTTATYK